MPCTPVDLHFADVAGRDHVLHAVTTNGHGWHVQTSLGGHLFTRHCGSWQGVERTMNWLRRHAHEQMVPPAPAPRAPGSIAASLALLMLFSALPAWAQPQSSADEALAAFSAATREYALIHRRIEQQLGPVEVNANPEEIYSAIQRMAAAMRNARPDAQQGDFFTPALASELRTRIATALVRHGFTREDVRIAELAEGIDATAITLRVHDAFPWVLGTAMFPCVLAALPALPPELQYRIVGDNLVLVDVHASLIVDILRDALRGPSVTTSQ